MESSSKGISSNILMKISGDKLVSGEEWEDCLNGTPSLLSLHRPSGVYFTLWLIRVFCGKRYLTGFLRYSNGTNGWIKRDRRAEGPGGGNMGTRGGYVGVGIPVFKLHRCSAIKSFTHQRGRLRIPLKELSLYWRHWRYILSCETHAFQLPTCITTKALHRHQMVNPG